MANRKVFGSALIIVGTSLGGGMLALPLASAGLGFLNTTLLIISCWVIMTYTALLMLELYQYASETDTLNVLAENLLGRTGKCLAIISSFFLFYALCAAYISGGGMQLSHKIGLWFNAEINPKSGIFLFTCLVGIIVYTGTHCVDIINRFLFFIKVAAIFLVFYLLIGYVEGTNLLAMPIEKGLFLTTLPVVFTAFGFHGSIPSIVRYNGCHLKSLKKIMIIGSSIPLTIYLLWQMVTLGSLSQTSIINNDSLDGFITLLSISINQPYIRESVALFADVALTTSFLGVSLGLFDLLANVFKTPDNKKGRIKIAIFTFLPPLVIVLLYPHAFIAALNFAAIPLVVIAIFLPVAMVYQQRKIQDDTGYRVIGGNLALLILMVVGCFIIFCALTN